METGDRRILLVLAVLLTVVAGVWVFGLIVDDVATEGGPAVETATAGTVASVTVDENGEATVTGSLPTETRPEVAPTATPKPRPKRPLARKPTIVQRPIPFDDARRADMAAYSLRHYGDETAELTDPKVIVEHFTVTTTFQATFDIFAPNRADAELGEKPGTCAHFVVDRDGTIYQLVPLDLRCRHTVGLNDRSIGIEQVAMTASEVLARPATSSPRSSASPPGCAAGTPSRSRDIIGHAESLTSPYHHENVARLRSQTHADWTKPQAAQLRKRIARYRCA